MLDHDTHVVNCMALPPNHHVHNLQNSVRFRRLYFGDRDRVLGRPGLMTCIALLVVNMSCGDHYDGTIRFWNALCTAEERVLIGHPKAVTSVAFSHDSRHVVSSYKDCTVSIWCVGTRKGVRSICIFA